MVVVLNLKPAKVCVPCKLAKHQCFGLHAWFSPVGSRVRSSSFSTEATPTDGDLGDGMPQGASSPAPLAPPPGPSPPFHPLAAHPGPPTPCSWRAS